MSNAPTSDELGPGERRDPATGEIFYSADWLSDRPGHALAWAIRALGLAPDIEPARKPRRWWRR